MRYLFSFCVLTFVVTNIEAADRTAPVPAVHKAVTKSISWLQSDMQTWRDERGCAACHHGPMYLWSIGTAKRRGYEIDEAQFAETTRWLLTDEEARIFPRQPDSAGESTKKREASDRMTAAMMGHKRLSQPTIYLAHARNALPDEEPLKTVAWQKVIEHLATAQADNGSFIGRNAWPPIFNTPQILTRFVVTGTRDAAGSSTAKSGDQLQSVLEKAERFLASDAPDETHQGLVLRLLEAQPQSNREPDHDDRAARSMLVTRLLSLQRSDGGWSQTSDRDSDAFATGQTLAALNRAGFVGDDLAIRRAIAFLVNTQQPDGTWPMFSRPNPETGKPAELLNPITYAATAWAVIGLTSYVPNASR